LLAEWTKIEGTSVYSWGDIETLPPSRPTIREAAPHEVEDWNYKMIIDWADDLATYWPIEKWADAIGDMLSCAEMNKTVDPQVFHAMIAKLIDRLKSTTWMFEIETTLPETSDD
jgi:hypothetical protein